jgi:hypothetical protein
MKIRFNQQRPAHGSGISEHRRLFGHPHILHHAGVHNSQVTNNHASSETKIGTANIHTQATDAAGIARDIKPALQRTGMAMQANYSLA